MDAVWWSVANFINREFASDAVIVAPIGFSGSLSVSLGYGNVQPDDADSVAVLVVHKGEYQKIDPRFLHRALDRLAPIFANEVFMILAANRTPLPQSDPHLGALKAMRNWSETESRPGDGANARARMQATYVGNAQILVETIDGHLVVAAADDRSITPHLVRDGYFEIGVPRFIQKFLRPGMTFVDVGANIGLYSLAAAAAVGAQGRIVAVEPMPRLRTLIIDNFSMNGFDRQALVLPFAAGAQSGDMQIHEFPRYNGATTLVDAVARLQGAKFDAAPVVSQVRVRTITEMLDEAAIARVDLFKIDTEGYEYEVLLGALEFLRRRASCDLVIEWHPAFRSEEDMRALLGLLTENLGCALETIEGDGSTAPIEATELMAVPHANLWVHGPALRS